MHPLILLFINIEVIDYPWMKSFAALSRLLLPRADAIRCYRKTKDWNNIAPFGGRGICFVFWLFVVGSVIVPGVERKKFEF
jgi:hypothetical protein